MFLLTISSKDSKSRVTRLSPLATIVDSAGLDSYGLWTWHARLAQHRVAIATLLFAIVMSALISAWEREFPGEFGLDPNSTPVQVNHVNYLDLAAGPRVIHLRSEQ